MPLLPESRGKTCVNSDVHASEALTLAATLYLGDFITDSILFTGYGTAKMTGHDLHWATSLLAESGQNLSFQFISGSDTAKWERLVQRCNCRSPWLCAHRGGCPS